MGNEMGDGPVWHWLGWSGPEWGIDWTVDWDLLLGGHPIGLSPPSLREAPDKMGMGGAAVRALASASLARLRSHLWWAGCLCHRCWCWWCWCCRCYTTAAVCRAGASADLMLLTTVSRLDNCVSAKWDIGSQMAGVARPRQGWVALGIFCACTESPRGK